MSKLQGRCPTCRKFESVGDIIRGYHKSPPAFLVIMADEKPLYLSDFSRVYADTAEQAAQRHVEGWDSGEEPPTHERNVFVYEEVTGKCLVLSVSVEVVVEYTATEATAYDAPEFPKLAELVGEEEEPEEEMVTA